MSGKGVDNGAILPTDKEELCRRIRQLPDEMTPFVSDFLDRLMDYDNEPLTEDELAQIEAANADISAGCFYTLEEFNRRMDALP